VISAFAFLSQENTATDIRAFVIAYATHNTHKAHDPPFILYRVTYRIFVVATLESDMSERATKFPTVERFRATESLTAAIRTAAARNTMSSSEYMRQAVIQRLRTDGIDPVHAEGFC
jgi:hypothetical protein